jgi:hypothetical protein
MKYLLYVLISSVSLFSFSQEIDLSDETNVTFYGSEHFLIEGSAVADSLKESPYDRLPS